MENQPVKPETPPILYQYRPPKGWEPEGWALDNLSRQVVYANAPANFNDPYECRIPPRFSPLITHGEYIAICRKIHQDSGNPRYKVIFPKCAGIEKLNGKLKTLFAAYRHTIGVACFSARRDNLLMWSHYANGGKGFCLAFDTRRDSDFFGKNGMYVMPVVYSAKLPNPDAYKFFEHSTSEPFFKLFSRKPKEWEYEQEWRAFALQKGTIRYKPESLKAVYFGTEAEEETKVHIRAIVKEAYPNVNVKFYNGRPSKTKYKVVFDRIL